MASLIWYRVAAAGAIGLIAWQGQLWAMPLCIVIPCLITVPTDSLYGRCTSCYYAAASLRDPGVAKGLLAVQ